MEPFRFGQAVAAKSTFGTSSLAPDAKPAEEKSSATLFKFGAGNSIASTSAPNWWTPSTTTLFGGIPSFGNSTGSGSTKPTEEKTALSGFGWSSPATEPAETTKTAADPNEAATLSSKRALDPATDENTLSHVDKRVKTTPTVAELALTAQQPLFSCDATTIATPAAQCHTRSEEDMTLEEHLKSISSHCGTAQQKIKTSMTELDAREADVKALEADVKALEAEVKALKAYVKAREANVKAREDKAQHTEAWLRAWQNRREARGDDDATDRQAFLIEKKRQKDLKAKNTQHEIEFNSRDSEVTKREEAITVQEEALKRAWEVGYNENGEQVCLYWFPNGRSSNRPTFNDMPATSNTPSYGFTPTPSNMVAPSDPRNTASFNNRGGLSNRGSRNRRRGRGGHQG